MIHKKLLIGIGILLYFVSAFVAFSYFSTRAGGPLVSPLTSIQQAGTKSTLTENGEAPKTEECPLNGTLHPKSFRSIWEGRRPLGVMIENHLDARNQSGLANADVVYEVVAEGGITRFLAIFYCQDAKLIGPVRSARIYFMELLRGYGSFPLYAHVGGANTPGPADALGTIRKINWDSYNDLNQFAIPFPYYWRDYERLPGVATEHTMYSTTQKLWEFAATKRDLTHKDKEGAEWNERFNPWKFTDGKATGSVGKFSFSFWSGRPTYDVVWSFDAATNRYSRAHGDGKKHLDKNTDTSITASNVVVAYMTESPARDGYPGGHLLYKTTGSGQALIFKNGEVIKGTWNRKDVDALIRFYDSSGKEIEFVRGPIWVEIVPTGNTVEY